MAAGDGCCACVPAASCGGGACAICVHSLVCASCDDRGVWFARLQACPAGTYYGKVADDDADDEDEDEDEVEDGVDIDEEDDDDDAFVCLNCPVDTYSANPASTSCAACPGAVEGASTC
jgi:hypothetical protein